MLSIQSVLGIVASQERFYGTLIHGYILYYKQNKQSKLTNNLYDKANKANNELPKLRQALALIPKLTTPYK